jgi:hypothetical protein
VAAVGCAAVAAGDAGCAAVICVAAAAAGGTHLARCPRAAAGELTRDIVSSAPSVGGVATLPIAASRFALLLWCVRFERGGPSRRRRGALRGRDDDEQRVSQPWGEASGDGGARAEARWCEAAARVRKAAV